MANQLGFCGNEERLTDSPCHSQYPNVAFDREGNIGITWQDTRDGNFEIYFKLLPSRIPTTDQTVGFTGAINCGFSGTHDIQLVGTSDTTGTTNPDSTSETAADNRLSCSLGSSLYPAIVADKDGRFHIVYQDNDTGKFQLYYVQVFPKSVGEKKCSGNNAPISGLDFADTAAGDATVPVNGVNYPPTGQNGAFFAYGNQALPDPLPSNTGSALLKTGLHTIYREFYPGTGTWTGVSKAADYQDWKKQRAAEGFSTSPSFFAPASHPIAGQDDFGSRHTFKNLAFLAKAPPDKDVKVSKIALPLKPSCLPTTPANEQTVPQNLVPAPRRPMPPTFTDPIDLSAMLVSPLVSTDDSSPARYTIEGDTSGTIYTNLLVDDGSGQLSRFFFTPDTTQEKPIFILGQRLCGTENCALMPTTTQATMPPPLQYSFKLQVWEAASYVTNTTAVTSAQLTGATRLLEKQFKFDPGETTTTFSFDDGELRLKAGMVYFFVPIADEGTDYHIIGVGDGNAVWSTGANDGIFDQYYVPFTLHPNAGLNAPVYYEGFLDSGNPDDPGTTAGWVLDNVQVSQVKYSRSAVKLIGNQVTPSNEQYYMTVSFFLTVPQDALAPNITMDMTCKQGTVTYASSQPLTTEVISNGRYKYQYVFMIQKAAATSTQSLSGLFQLSLSVKTTDSKYVPAGNTQSQVASIDSSFEIPLALTLSTYSGPLNILTKIDSGLRFATPTSPTLDATAGAAPATAAVPDPAASGYSATWPLQLTNSNGDSTHPRLAIDSRDNIWLVFQSNRTGQDEIYVAKYFGSCGQWGTSTAGGTEFQLTRSTKGSRASFPSVAVNGRQEAEIVWQSTDTEDGMPEIFYSQSTAGGLRFLYPIRLTSSPGGAMVPDIVVSRYRNDNGFLADMTTVVWHDDRYGQFEIMSCYKREGKWFSSGQGETDNRITNALGDSLYPRIASDMKGNLRVVYHDYRQGEDNPWVYMSSYLVLADRWASSGQNATDIPITPTGTRGSWNPDIDIDQSNSLFITWFDLRFSTSQNDRMDEIMGTYCSKSEGIGSCDIPIPDKITGDIEGFIEVVVTICQLGSRDEKICGNYRSSSRKDYSIVNGVATRDGGPATTITTSATGSEQAIPITTDQTIGLSIYAPGATFYRLAGDDLVWSEWKPFVPAYDLDTMFVKYTLSNGNGLKNIYVQVQDALTIGFPVKVSIILQGRTPLFEIELFRDEALTDPVGSFKGHSVIAAGETFLKITPSVPLGESPFFEVISRGVHLTRNQQTVAGVVGSGMEDPEYYIGRFVAKRHDGFYNVDGPARIIVHGKDKFGQTF
jgi:hypothetical protein